MNKIVALFTVVIFCTSFEESQHMPTSTTTIRMGDMEIEVVVPDVPSGDGSFGENDPEVRPGLYEGDMADTNQEAEQQEEPPDERLRLGLRWDVFPKKKWANGTVPFVISPLYAPREYNIIETAIRILGFITCVDFQPWDGKVKDYLLIWPVKKPSGCWSFVGKLGGPQLVSLEPPGKYGPNCLGGIGRPLHEIMHALGIFHEQSRPDRDQYIKINEANVIKGYLNNFDKHSEKNTTTFGLPYDYSSIMHYGSLFFSKSKDKPTVVPLKKGARIGQRENMSMNDCLKVNALYGCFDKSKFDAVKYKTMCKYIGL